MITTQQKNEYIKGFNFGLTDFNRTFEKYDKYKEQKVEDFFKEHEEEIKDYLEELDFIIENSFNSNFYGLDLYNRIHDNPTKKDIRAFKFFINQFTYDKNKEFIKDLLENSNDNEVRAFTIILYLKNYHKINEQMKNCFENLLIDEDE